MPALTLPPATAEDLENALQLANTTLIVVRGEACADVVEMADRCAAPYPWRMVIWIGWPDTVPPALLHQIFHDSPDCAALWRNGETRSTAPRSADPWELEQKCFEAES